MKIILHSNLRLIIYLLLSSTYLFGQNPIPNPGFENWSGNTPTNWSAATNLFGVGEPITKSTDSFSGSLAVRGEVLSTAGTSLVPVLYTGTLTNPTFLTSERHQIFSGYYKFEGQEGDILRILVALGDNSTSNGASGVLEISSNATTYTYLEITLDYGITPEDWNPEYGSITATIVSSPGSQTAHVGSYFLVDHFTFDGQVVSVDEYDSNLPKSFALEQNYPNPFNPSTKIKFRLPELSFVNLTVYDLLGSEIKTLVNQNLPAGNYLFNWDADGLPSGVYIYTYRAGGISISRKMMLLK